MSNERTKTSLSKYCETRYRVSPKKRTDILHVWYGGPEVEPAGFVTGLSQVEYRSEHIGHYVVPMSRGFTHICSRSTQPSHPCWDGNNEKQPCAAAKTDTFPRFTMPEPGNS